MEKTTFVYNKDTYNAYDAQRIVFEACKYKSEITFADGMKNGNAKSIIGLLSMKFLKGDTYTVLAEGPDSKKAVKGMTEFIAKL